MFATSLQSFLIELRSCPPALLRSCAEIAYFSQLYSP